jgi:acetyl-CoA carboxylase beta subunit
MTWYKTAQTDQKDTVSYTDSEKGNWYLSQIPCSKCKKPIWRFEMSAYLLCIDCEVFFNAMGTPYLEPKIMDEKIYKNMAKKTSSEIKKNMGKKRES